MEPAALHVAPGADASAGGDAAPALPVAPAAQHASQSRENAPAPAPAHKPDHDDYEPCEGMSPSSPDDPDNGELLWRLRGLRILYRFLVFAQCLVCLKAVVGVVAFLQRRAEAPMEAYAQTYDDYHGDGDIPFIPEALLRGLHHAWATNGVPGLVLNIPGVLLGSLVRTLTAGLDHASVWAALADLFATLVCGGLLWIAVHRTGSVRMPQEILARFLAGQPKGTVMLSYAWADGTALPRRVAGLFPCAWVDVANLIPGVHVQQACEAAAREAKFRLVFMSEAYMKSRNCQMEWAVIRAAGPQGCFVFAHDDTPVETLEELREEGFHVFMLSEIRLGSPARWSRLHAVWRKCVDALCCGAATKWAQRRKPKQQPNNDSSSSDGAKTAGAGEDGEWIPLVLRLGRVLCCACKLMDDEEEDELNPEADEDNDSQQEKKPAEPKPASPSKPANPNVTKHYEVPPLWLLRQLIRTGVLQTLFREYSPAVNEEWEASVDALRGTPRFFLTEWLGAAVGNLERRLSDRRSDRLARLADRLRERSPGRKLWTLLACVAVIQAALATMEMGCAAFLMMSADGSVSGGVGGAQSELALEHAHRTWAWGLGSLVVALVGAGLAWELAGVERHVCGRKINHNVNNNVNNTNSINASGNACCVAPAPYGVRFPDSANLLRLLRLLRVLGRPVRVYNDAPPGMRNPLGRSRRSLRQLIDANILLLVGAHENPDVVIRCLDHQDAEERKEQEERKERNESEPVDPEHVMYWSQGGYSTLPRAVKDKYGHSIINTGFPGVEEICVRALAAAQGCPLDRIVVGTGRFRYSQPEDQ